MLQWISAVVLILSCISGIEGAVDKNSCLKAHNKLRALHENTNPLQWDTYLAREAQKYAEELVRINKASSTVKLINSPADGNGENLYYRENIDLGTCTDASLAWYKEIDDYSYSRPYLANSKMSGRFTQLVWKNTQRFGVGVATMQSRNKNGSYGSQETFIVAKYSPQGNLHATDFKWRDYTANVLPRKQGSKTPTIEELDPSRVPDCADILPFCKALLKSYKCNDQIYGDYFKKNCYKECKYC